MWILLLRFLEVLEFPRNKELLPVAVVRLVGVGGASSQMEGGHYPPPAQPHGGRVPPTCYGTGVGVTPS